MNILQREENPGLWLAISVVIRGKPISSLPTKCEAFLWVQKFHCQVRNMSPPFPLHPGKSSLILGLCQPRRSREQARYEKVELVFFLDLYDTLWSKMTDETYHCCVVDIIFLQYLFSEQSLTNCWKPQTMSGSGLVN